MEWNFWSLYRAGALGFVNIEIEKYSMYLVGVQKASREGSDTLGSGNYTLFYGESNANHQLGTGIFFIGKLGQH